MRRETAVDKKLTAILIKATDVRESDKTVRLFSAEEGRVTATMRGVRKPAAKMKYAAQPFALCVYEVSEKNGKKIVTGATPVEDLYPLCLDPEKYAAACVMLEVTDNANSSVENAKLFVTLLKALKTLLYGKAASMVVVTKFIQKVLSMSGFVKPPARVDDEPDAPAKALGFIAYKTLDELNSVEIKPGVMKRAMRAVAVEFCREYETELTSLAVYEKLL